MPVSYTHLDGGAAGHENTTHLGGRHADDRVLALLTHELAGGTSGTGDSNKLSMQFYFYAF